MTKKLLNPEESKPHGYFREGETVKKTDKSSTESLVNSMRTDMVPASSALPESKKIIQRVNLKAIGGGFIGLVILGLIWLALAGPGRPFLEQNLAKLLKIKSTSTQLEVPNSMNVTNTPAKPIITLSAASISFWATASIRKPDCSPNLHSNYKNRCFTHPFTFDEYSNSVMPGRSEHYAG